MYVCLCHQVTDRQIRSAVEQGSSSLRDLATELKVATCCGKCRPLAESLLEAGAAETACAIAGRHRSEQPVREQPLHRITSRPTLRLHG